MFKIGLFLFIILQLFSCSQGGDYPYEYYRDSEYTHLIKPIDSLTIIKSIEYPEASKRINYDSAGAQRLLVSAYANTQVKITTNTGVFDLLINPNVKNSQYSNAISYLGYKILNHNFNEYVKTSKTEIKHPLYSNAKIYLDTLYFK